MKPPVWIGLLFASLSHAGTLIFLVPPVAPQTLHNVHTTSCSATMFSQNGTELVGICQYTYGPGCGRYCFTAAEDYAVTWDLSGHPSVGMWCSSTTAGIVNHRTTTLNPAYSGPKCSVNYQGTDTVIEVNGAPYWYGAVNSIGDVLVCNAYGCYVELSS